MSRLNPTKAPERATQRAMLQNTHPRHVHPRRKRLQGRSLERAVRTYTEALDQRTVALERRQMASGAVSHVSADGLRWLWGALFGAAQ